MSIIQWIIKLLPARKKPEAYYERRDRNRYTIWLWGDDRYYRVSQVGNRRDARDVIQTLLSLDSTARKRVIARRIDAK